MNDIKRVKILFLKKKVNSRPTVTLRKYPEERSINKIYATKSLKITENNIKSIKSEFEQKINHVESFCLPKL